MITLIQINDQVFEFKDAIKTKSLKLKNILNIQATNTLRVVGKGSLATEIKCFIYDPPPPEFRGCPQCGTYIMESNETINFLSANQLQWIIKKGIEEITLIILDQDGDIVKARILI